MILQPSLAGSAHILLKALIMSNCFLLCSDVENLPTLTMILSFVAGWKNVVSTGGCSTAVCLP